MLSWPSTAYHRVRPYIPRLAGVLLFRYLCFGIMIGLALLGERRPAPHLPDLIIDHLPYQAAIDRWNSWILVACYLPVALCFLFVDPARFCRYNVSTGLLSLLRGLCILATGLGPVRGPDVNANMACERLARAWVELMSPLDLLLHDSAHVYMTKDLFFSGHTGVTFLILLYVWPVRWLRAMALITHMVVVASVFLSHLHYTIDVIGAYAITHSLFVLRERRGAPSY